MAIDADTTRMMTNWARWRDGGGMSSCAITAAYDLEARGRREEVSMPLINGEALDVDGAVKALDAELQEAVVQWWVKQGNAEKKAAACGCVVKTLYNRLDQAHRRIHSHLSHLREQGRRAREAYRAGVKT